MARTADVDLPRSFRSLPVWLAALLGALWSFAPAQAGVEDGYERWYSIRIQGEPAGWMRTSRSFADGRVVSDTEMKLKVSRGALSLEVSMGSAFVETPAGEPVSMTARQAIGAAPTETVFNFEEDGIRAVTAQGGRTSETMLSSPEGAWLTPAQAEAYTGARLKAGAEEIVVRTIEPLSGPRPITITRSNFRPERLEINGRVFEAIRCDVTSSSTPGLTTSEYLDAEGSIIKTVVSMSGLPIEMTLADASVAEGELAAPELLVSTFIRPDRRIDAPRRVRRAVYRLTGPEGALASLPTTGTQSVRALGAGSAEVRVDVAARAGADVDEAGARALLASTSFLNADDVVVRGLTAEAVRAAGDDPAAQAEAMRAFVYRHVTKKNLGVGFASAAEVARSREGDCTEHAALLAAMLRAGGIPSRVASGLIYADQFAGEREIFGFHMWTQALLPTAEGRAWVDLDATLPPGLAYDATHITLAVSDMSEGEAQGSLSSIAPLLGTLSIEVVETER